MANTPKFKFEKLRIWQDAMDLGEEINGLADTFPSKETYNLSSQTCRAIDSVALNISEETESFNRNCGCFHKRVKIPG